MTPAIISVEGLSLIRTTGDDAVQFLHGQFTQHIQDLGDEVRSAGYCSPKGRLLATMRAYRGADNAVMLLVPSDIVEGFLKRQRIYVLRSRVALELVEGAKLFAFLGGEGAKAAAALGLELPVAGRANRSAGLALLGLQPTAALSGIMEAGARTLAVAEERDAAAELEKAAQAGSWWTVSEAAAGVAVVHEATKDAFVPQHVNFELAGGVVFNKGCYPGQEVISRMQHIGRTNRRAALGIHAGPAPLPGAPVYAGGKEAGIVVDAAQINGRAVVFYSATLDALAAGATLEPDGPRLEKAALPYAVPGVD